MDQDDQMMSDGADTTATDDTELEGDDMMADAPETHEEEEAM